MKKVLLAIAIVLSTIVMTNAHGEAAYNFGDFRSETLVGKAWKALADNDMGSVLAYTSKCIELYGEQAKKMQASLKEYPAGESKQIFSYWALNDLATALFIQGEAYRKNGMKDEAVTAYKKVIDQYSFGQAWDPQGWFWKPAEAAKEKLAMLESGSTLDFGDYSSSYLTTQAWKALANKDMDAVNAYVDKVLELYAPKAMEMQKSLTEYPWESKDKIFSYWALNDVGTSLYIKAEAFKKAGMKEEAEKSYKKLVDEYFYAQCWDPQGWFWKPAEAAQQALDELEELNDGV